MIAHVVKPLFPAMPNFRDLRGLESRDGRRVKAGRLFRSGSLANLSDAEWAAFETLGVGLFVDLRGTHERETHRIPWSEPSPRICALEVLPDVRASGTEIMQRLLDDTDGSWTSALLQGNYAAMPHALVPLGPALFEAILANGDAATVIACTAGQDRTGFVVALLLSVLDIPEEAIFENYMQSARHHDPDRISRFIAKTLGESDPRLPTEAALAAMSVSRDYLKSSLDVIERDYGGMAAYLQRIGLSDDQAEALRNTYLM